MCTFVWLLVGLWENVRDGCAAFLVFRVGSERILKGKGTSPTVGAHGRQGLRDGRRRRGGVPFWTNVWREEVTPQDGAGTWLGEVLMEDFIEGFGITQHKLAVAISVPPRRINEIVHGKRGITADTAMRLSRYFGTSPGFWMNLQMRYEHDRAEDALGDTSSGSVPLTTVEVA